MAKIQLEVKTIGTETTTQFWAASQSKYLSVENELLGNEIFKILENSMLDNLRYVFFKKLDNFPLKFWNPYYTPLERFLVEPEERVDLKIFFIALQVDSPMKSVIGLILI
jgi:hypothetical protein